MTYSARQNLMIRALLAVVAKVGAFTRDSTGSEGAGYVPAAINTGADNGFKCENCAFWRVGGKCAIVRGGVEPQGLCKLHVIPQSRLAPQPISGNGIGRIRGEVLKP